MRVVVEDTDDVGAGQDDTELEGELRRIDAFGQFPALGGSSSFLL